MAVTVRITVLTNVVPSSLLSLLTLPVPCRQRQQVPLKCGNNLSDSECCYISARLHSVTFQKKVAGLTQTIIYVKSCMTILLDAVSATTVRYWVCVVGYFTVATCIASFTRGIMNGRLQLQ